MEIFSDGQSGYEGLRTRQTFSYERSGSGQKMDGMDKMTEHMVAAAPFVGTALFGCLLQMLKTGWQGWRNFTVSNLSAAFGAWLVYCLVGDLFSPGWGQAVSGMIGYSGGKLVDVALAALTHKVEHMPVPMPQTLPKPIPGEDDDSED